MLRFCWLILGGCLVLGASAAEGPPTKAEAEALLATLREAAAGRDGAAILAMLDDAFEIKTTLRLGPSDRLFLHTREELVAELPKLLTPAAAPKVHTHLLSLTPAGDAPAALMKYQWAITLARPEGDVRVEATGGVILQREGGAVRATKGNQLISGADGKKRLHPFNPRDSKQNTQNWTLPKPKPKAQPESGDETPAEASPAPGP
jgi:hypothetical protein